MSRRRFAFDVEPDESPAAAERLFLARISADGRMPVLRTGLAREENQLLGAIAVGVDVDHDLQPGSLQVAEAEVRDLDSASFLLRQRDALPLQDRRRSRPRLARTHALAHSARSSRSIMRPIPDLRRPIPSPACKVESHRTSRPIRLEPSLGLIP